MKKLFYSAAFCAATLLGLAGCSSDPLMPEPVNPAVGIIGGVERDYYSPWMEGPTSIELDRLYTFTAKSNIYNDTFTFTVEDTYFNDPSSYAINVSPSGTRINVVFNDYGHYKITAKSRATGKECSYEVAKYYKEIGLLKYCSNAFALQDGIRASMDPISRRFERYQSYTEPLGFSGIIKNYQQRIVVNTVEYYMEYWYPVRESPYMKRGRDLGTITGIAAKGADYISLPEGYALPDPNYNHQAVMTYAVLVPFCNQEFTIPEERCGAL